jgi:hypothetical protein
MQYFPLEARLKAFHKRFTFAKLMHYHSENINDQGLLVGHKDGKAWNHVHIKY